MQAGDLGGEPSQTHCVELNQRAVPCRVGPVGRLDGDRIVGCRCLGRLWRLRVHRKVPACGYALAKVGGRHPRHQHLVRPELGPVSGRPMAVRLGGGPSQAIEVRELHLDQDL